MKRLVLVLLFFFFVGQVNAQSAGLGAPQGTVVIAPPSIQNPPFLGQDHYYSVQFRGNGEAVVNLKTIFSNLQESELSTLTFRTPKGITIENILAYQILRDPQCIRYQTQSNTSDPRILEKEMYRVTNICEEYGQPDYFNYDYSSTKYQKALSMNENGTITIALPQPVATNETGSLIIYFTSPSYVKKNAFGAFDYAFGSLRVEDKIRTLQVGVNVDSDWYLKGVSGKVQYSLSESALSFKDSALSRPAMNLQFMNYYQEVGQGALVKNASNLQPLDSYLVEGSYASSQMALYGKQILIGLLIFVLVLLFVGFFVRLLIRKFRSPDVSHSHNFFIASATSFIAAFLGVGYTVFVFFLLNALNNGSYYEWIGMFSVLLTLISIGVYIVILVVPAIFIGLKRSMSWGVITITLTISWLMLFSMLIFIVLFLFREADEPVYPMMYEKAVPTIQSN